MCSRECYSVSHSRFLIGILIFLATFMLSVSVVSGLRSLVRGLDDLPIATDIEQPLELVPEASDVSVVYTGRGPCFEPAQRNFRLTNNGPAPIYLEFDKGVGWIVVENHEHPRGANTATIPAGGSAALNVNIPVDESSYQLAYSYFDG